MITIHKKYLKSGGVCGIITLYCVLQVSINVEEIIYIMLL